MSSLYRDLSWLPKPPTDFRARCRGIAASADAAAELRALSGFALDGTQLRQLTKAADTLVADGPLAGFQPFRLGLLGNATLTEIVPALRATALRYGIDLTIVKADYGQMLQEALEPTSRLNQAGLDAVLLAIDHRGLGLDRPEFDETVQSERVAGAVDFIASLRRGFREHGKALCIVQTIAPPPETIFGSADRHLTGGSRKMYHDVNDGLAQSLANTTDVLVDVAGLAENVGLANWHSPTQWNVAKFAFDTEYIPLYAEHVVRVIAATLGKSRRCLILDLDNTVWGGIIGDDGLDGILIGQGDATGEAHLTVQQTALMLRERGVALAVSSKNTDDVARRVFREHPEMVLRENHIAVFQANWNDKATNITAIAKELSLGLQSMVFLDDNPVERALVRRMLPEVAVPELPEDPALYARTLNAAGYFEAVVFSEEDRKRAEFYQGNAKRAQLQGAVGNLDEYLQSLAMRITFAPFDATGRSRIAQLISKSNQFNLTTRRYSENEVAALEADSSIFTMQVRLADIFGDNGMISVIVCRPAEAQTWEIDTWLMSCRVLGRKVERMVLREILHHARKRGIRNIVGTFIPTERNAMVSDHYEKLGFAALGPGAGGETRWTLATTTEIDAAPMDVDNSAYRIETISGEIALDVARI